MTKTPIKVQDLRRRIYLKAKADKAWRFWGLYVHVCKRATLHEAYKVAKRNNGACIDTCSPKAVGVEAFLQDIRDELLTGPVVWKFPGKFRTLGIPSIRDRVVQGGS